MIVTNRPRRTTAREVSTITGFDDLYRQLEENLPKATSRAALQRAGKTTMQPMKDRIEESAPVRTGQTKASVRMTTRLLKATARFGAALLVQVGVGSREIFWPKFEEHGTVKEPARPWIRPAFDNGVAGMLERLNLALGIEIRKSIARRQKKLSRRG